MHWLSHEGGRLNLAGCLRLEVKGSLLATFEVEGRLLATFEVKRRLLATFEVKGRLLATFEVKAREVSRESSQQQQHVYPTKGSPQLGRERRRDFVLLMPPTATSWLMAGAAVLQLGVFV